MSITAVEDGEERTERYAAASLEQLRKENPDAHAIYQRYDGWAGGQPAGFRIGGLQVGAGAAPVFIQPLPPIPPVPQPTPFDNLVAKIRAQLIKADAPRDQRAQVMDRLETIRKLRDDGADITDEQRDQRVAKLFQASDDLRKKLAELKVTEPDDEAIPPPAKARLGIVISQIDQAVTVQRVVAGMRGAKLGLQAGDVIEKVNGKPVKGLAELRRRCRRTNVSRSSITRDGRTMEIKE